MSITVIKPGLLSSFQDLGRVGYQHLGVSVGGAMDSRAHRLANLLAGNPEDEATLEITLAGPTLRFDAPGCIAISGAQLSPTLNQAPVPNNRPLVVRAGDVLAFGPRTAGLRAYIAWNGGIDLPTVLSSRSTYLRGGFGGFHGRALRKGDVLAMRRQPDSGRLAELEQELWKIKVYLPAILGLAPRTAIRAMRGAHTGLFTESSIAGFFADDYRISPQSERMGYRLEGARLSLKSATQLLSEATSFGSIQVPPDGKPIVLMADRQTTGGYAKIAHVATVDLPVIAQCMPGETLRFVETTLDHAQQLDSQREEAFGRLHQSLASLRQLFEG
ncbi:5-oxoprolinase subunit C family protein [Pollutimonas bauzanensis]|uniref:Biotin-dependent carboxylase uncharacterized domain-containing protein n=1 Tax=Pollutimonas bauzanensis TaxID=658167 RepID=A0A1M5RB59_9BURK|nr:biotin-dependent carboxyltransferase family protein [Pollutimonas bauzanensis]SHH23309.1 biotin-dependent carboxylase uncharacterized domain-containing protein [Pollutimonas bauzanensis]